MLAKIYERLRKRNKILRKIFLLLSLMKEVMKIMKMKFGRP